MPVRYKIFNCFIDDLITASMFNPTKLHRIDDAISLAIQPIFDFLKKVANPLQPPNDLTDSDSWKELFRMKNSPGVGHWHQTFYGEAPATQKELWLKSLAQLKLAEFINEKYLERCIGKLNLVTELFSLTRCFLNRLRYRLSWCQEKWHQTFSGA